MQSITETDDGTKSGGSSLAAPPADAQGNVSELRGLLHALQAMGAGDFSVRMPGDGVGLMGKIADTFNEIAAANGRMGQQLERVQVMVGREGKTRRRRGPLSMSAASTPSKASPSRWRSRSPSRESA
jgi:hypothetical protein